jgi:hypothetical protein
MIIGIIQLYILYKEAIYMRRQLPALARESETREGLPLLYLNMHDDEKKRIRLH